MTRMRIGLVGCGNIGADICIALQKRTIPADISALVDLDPERVALFQRTFQLNAPACSLEEAAASCDFLIECAGAAGVKAVVEAAIPHRRAMLVMSVGGLMMHEGLMEKAKAAGVNIRIPSGALSAGWTGFARRWRRACIR